ncbi:MAG: hemerythrin domain-containing protein [Frankiaceae bacterium]
MDITELILNQHHEQRRTFALLDDIDRGDADRLTSVWARLEVLLEVHAAAEEEFFYPRLLRIGKGGGSASDAPDEVSDAVKDHNEIRDAIREVARHEVGSDTWWGAVAAAREANSDHMAEEEREDLPDFRRNADLQTRHEIALEFLDYESRHAAGIAPRDKDPQVYVDSHQVDSHQ